MAPPKSFSRELRVSTFKALQREGTRGCVCKTDKKQDAVKPTEEIEPYLWKKLLPGSGGEVTADAPYC